MATYIAGKAPLTLVRTLRGPMEYVYAGQPAPEGIVPEELDRLLDEGFLEEVELPEEANEAADSGGAADEDAPPAKAAAKAAWVDYRANQRGEEHREVLDGLTKEQLQDDAAVDAVLQPAQS